VWRHCETHGLRGRTVTLKVKYADFRQITRSHSVPGVVASRAAAERLVLDLLRALLPVEKGVRLLGVSFSALVDEAASNGERQFSLPL